MKKLLITLLILFTGVMCTSCSLFDKPNEIAPSTDKWDGKETIITEDIIYEDTLTEYRA